MAEVRVSPEGEGYLVTVEDGGSRTEHHVTVPDSSVTRFGAADEAALVEASFRFLLEREPKEAILARFDLSVIERFFPEYPRRIASYL